MEVLMKGSTFHAAAVFVCLSLGVYGQGRQWVVPPGVVRFAAGGPVMTPLPAPAPGPYAVANGAFDSSGNLLFSVVNRQSSSILEVYDGKGTAIGTAGGSGQNFSHQIAVVNVPGFCTRYYILWFASKGFIGVDLHAAIVDLDLGQVLPPTVVASYSDNRGALAVGRLRADGTRLLYAMAYPKVQKFVIGSGGIVADSTLADANAAGFYPTQAVLSNDGSRLAWNDRQSGRVWVASLDADGDLAALASYNTGSTAGLAFSPDRSRLFFSTTTFPAAGPISAIDLASSTFTALAASSSAYAGSLLQLAADGRIYAASSTDLGAIDPATLAFTSGAVPGVAAGAVKSPFGGERTLPYQINGEPQFACDSLCGNPSLIQGNLGTKGNFELVVPWPGGGMAHYWRDNDGSHEWHGPTVFGTNAGVVDAVSLIQSTFGGGHHLEVVARIGDRLAHFWRGNDAQWRGPTDVFASGAAGTPSLIQNRFGAPGDFEVVTPLAGGGMAHYARNNQWLAWSIPVTFGTGVGVVSDVSMIQSTFGGGGHLEVVARVGDRLAHFWRGNDLQWHGPTVVFGSGIAGPPSLIQNRATGHFEVAAPLAGGGMALYTRDNNTHVWSGPVLFGGGRIRSVSLIQGNYGDNLELVAREDCDLVHYWREGFGTFAWSTASPIGEVMSACVPPAVAAPAAQQSVAGMPATFKAAASGKGQLEYQWLRNGQPVADDDRTSGAKTSALTLGYVLFEDAGNYSVRVKNACGVTTSAPAALSVSPTGRRAIPAGEVIPRLVRLGYGPQDATEAKLQHAGAAFIKVHIADLDLRPGDVVSIQSPDGKEKYVYPNAVDDGGAERRPFWALSIDGDTAVVRLERRAPKDLAVRTGVRIERFTRGFTESEIAALTGESTATSREPSAQALCGADDTKDVACYSGSNPAEVTQSRAVARLLLNGGTSLCTGWRVGPDSADLMFTNNHCIAGQTDVDAAEAQFNFQAASCGGAAAGTVKVKGRTFLQTNSALDWTLFTVHDHWAIGGFGFLEIDPRVPVAGEEIYIPQHPGGGRKKFGIESDSDAGNRCRIGSPVTGANTSYRCDTKGGSSGSPVLARNGHRVLAIHHSGATCFNVGTRFNTIWPQIRSWFQWRFLWGATGQIALWYMNNGDKYTVGDFDADNQDELVAVSAAGWAHLMEMNGGNWQWLWGNGGAKQIGLWLMNPSDRYFAGDFDGDSRDELMAVANNGWSHLMRWNGSSWNWFWGNGGSGRIALWNMHPLDRYYVGDFDGDGRDELMTVGVNGWSHVMRWDGSSWQWMWGNGGAAQIALWYMHFSDQYVVGDFDNDGRDELQAIALNGWSHLMRWGTGGWQWVWGNGGNRTIALWNMGSGDRYYAADVDGDGRDELLAMSANSWVHLMRWNGSSWQWFWGNGGMGHFALWYMKATDRHYIGNFTSGADDEVLSLSAGKSAHVSEFMP
jgi:lysyl endopeptidase